MTQTLPAHPVRLGRATLLHLPGDLCIRPIDGDATYWNHVDRRAELREGRILSVFDYDSTWTWWERHPVGDELAFLLSGEADLLLEEAAGQTAATRLAPGDSAVIPAGAWHSARILAPSTILFVTPTPARTEHRPA